MLNLNYIYKPMVMNNANFFVIFNEKFKIPKNKLLMLYVLLIHVI